MIATVSCASLLGLRRLVVVHSATVLMAGVLLGAPAVAQQPKQGGSTVQGAPNALQGFSQNRDKPIRIDALSLEVRDKEKAATFSGNVKVVQGDTTMYCKVLLVFYDQDQSGGTQNKSAMKSASPGPGGSSSIRRLEAKGGVRVEQKDQIVTGDNGVFDTKSNLVTVNGNVVLTQAQNVLKGDKLVVDMTTGVSRVESTGNKGVQAIFDTKSNANGSGSTSPLGLGSAKNANGANSNASSPRETAPAPSRKPLDLNSLSGGSTR